jgi:hypothetical protein
MKKEERVFFFEKKKQKTFVSSRWPEHPLSFHRHCEAPRPAQSRSLKRRIGHVAPGIAQALGSRNDKPHLNGILCA